MKYLNLYGHIFNHGFLLWVRKEAILDLRKAYLFQPKTFNPLRNKGRYFNIFRLHSFILTYCRAIVHFCFSFNFQPSIFCITVFWDFNRRLCPFPSRSYGALYLASWIYYKWTSWKLPETPSWIFLQRHPCIYKTLISTSTATSFILVSCLARVAEFANVKVPCFFLLNLTL